MIKRVVVTTGLKARGYVDGRYVGEEKKEPGAAREDVRGRTKRRGKAGSGMGNGPAGAGNARRGKKRGPATQGTAAGGDNLGNAVGAKRGRRGKPQGRTQGQGQPTGDGQPFAGNLAGAPSGKGRGQPRNQARKNRTGKKTPFRPAPLAAMPSPSEAAEMRRLGDGTKSGQFAEALAAQANVKRERLHKVLAQSGHGSRRDMEIMISSGRVMVNGIVATTGTQVSPGDNVMVDQRPVKIKFMEDLPRVLLYHKPEGEIVTTSDPGNRITVFDNLPKVENGKWTAIGRLDINTSGLLIFTTSGELANRFMHPRYEVEREYAVRILGELTEEQTQALMSGVNIDVVDEDEDEEVVATSVPARFDTIEKRGGEGANQWYHVTIKEGRNREVRKMFETQGLTVSRLIRTRFGKIELPPRLSRGKMMELTPDQVRSVLLQAGMKEEAGVGPNAPLPSRQQQEPRRRENNRPPRAAIPVAEGEIPADVELTGEPGSAVPPPRDPGTEKGRQRRNRRGGKNRRGPNAGGLNGAPVVRNFSNVTGESGQATVIANVHASGDESGASVADSSGSAPGTLPGAAAGNTVPRGDRPPGKNSRNRSRRNFRGRNGRNRNPNAGESGANGNGGQSGVSNAGDNIGNTGGKDGNRDGNGGGNTGGNGNSSQDGNRHSGNHDGGEPNGNN